jgi:membrane protease YdiL (CAAX protease family)
MMLSFSLDPAVISWTYVMEFVLVVPLAALALRKPHQSCQEALLLNPVPIRTLVLWLGLLFIYLLLATLCIWLLPLSSTPFIQALSGSQHLGFSLTAVMLAPLMEEIVFRVCGVQLCRKAGLGLIFTLLLTSSLFTLIHFNQYTAPVLLLIFIFGLMLGLARIYTDSLLTPVLMHTINNLYAVLLIIWAGVGV